MDHGGIQMIKPILLSLLLTTSVFASPVVLEVPKGMGSHFVDTCLKHDVPIDLAWRLIKWESDWNEQAVNYNRDGTRDLGIMQLNSQWIGHFSERYNGGDAIDVWMWRTSMAVGIAHLSRLYSVTGSWPGAVAAYNVGLTRYRRGKLPESTRNMVAYVVKGER